MAGTLAANRNHRAACFKQCSTLAQNVNSEGKDYYKILGISKVRTNGVLRRRTGSWL